MKKVPATSTSSADDPVAILRLCPHCQASVEVDRKKCWLCGNPLTDDNPFASPLVDRLAAAPLSGAKQTTVPETPEGGLNTLFIVLLVICFGVVVLLGIGIAQNGADALIPYLVVVLPAFLVTGVRALWQVSDTGQVKGGRLLLSFVLTLSATIAVLVLIGIALIVALFVICLKQT